MKFKFFVLVVVLIFALTHCGAKAKQAGTNVNTAVTQNTVTVAKPLLAKVAFPTPTGPIQIGAYFDLVVTASGGSGNYKVGMNPAVSGQALISFSSTQVGADAITHLVGTFQTAGTYPLSVIVSDGNTSVNATTTNSFTVSAPAATPPPPAAPDFVVVLAPSTIYLGNQITLQIAPTAISGPITAAFVNNVPVPPLATAVVGTPSAVGHFAGTVLCSGPGGTKTVNFAYDVLAPLAPDSLVLYRHSHPNGETLPSQSTTEVSSPWVLEGPVARLLTTMPDAQIVPLYRCYINYPRGDHFITLAPNCEGAAHAVNEGVLGYGSTVARTYSGLGAPVRIYRYFNSGAGTHSFSTTPGGEGGIIYGWAP